MAIQKFIRGTAFGVIGAAALATGIGAGTASAAVAETCTGTLTGTYPAIVVPDGETCTLDGAQVKGNVKVGIGSTLMTADAMIKGNVFGQQAMRVHIIDTDVWGQIHFRRTAKEIIIGNDGCKVDPNAGGNINLQNNYGPIGICQMTIKNNIILHNNHNRIGVFDNRVGNNIEVMSNTSAAIRLRDNTMKGGLLIKGNTVAKVLNVSTNTIGGNANCTMNLVAPTGSGNTAGGALSGQCAGLG